MNKGTLHVFRAERARLLRTRRVWAFPFLIALIAGGRAWLGANSLLTHGGVDAGSGWHGLALGARTGLILAGLFLLFQAARGLAGDATSLVLRLALTRGATRGALLRARILLGLLQVLSIVLLAWSGAILGATLGGDFADLTIDGYVLGDSAENLTAVVKVFLATTLALFALWNLGLLAASFASTAVQAVALAFALFLAFDLFKELLGGAASWTFLAHVPSLLDSSLLNHLVDLTGLAVSTAVWDTQQWRIGLVACPLWFLLLALLAQWRLARRPL